MTTNKVPAVVQFGLSAIIVVLFLLGSIGMYKVRTTNNEISSFIHDNNTKVLLAHELRDAIRLRQISLNKMLAMSDPFDRDEELIRFYELAGIYRNARDKLVMLPMDQAEKSLYAKLTDTVRLAQPLNQVAAERIANDEGKDAIKESVQSAFLVQEQLLDLLNQLVSFQDDRANKAVHLGAAEYDRSLAVVMIVGLFVMGVALYIVSRVAKYVETKNVELMAATQAKSVFLATMSHEIRTPLTAIIGFAEASLDSDQSIQDRVLNTKTIIRSGRHLLKIINSILDLSKIEAEKLETECVEVSPFEVLADVESIVRPQAEEKGLRFQIKYALPLPKLIVSDPLRLKQILINLACNAIKFTDTGHVVINVVFDENTKNIKFTVNDSGIGMTAEQLAKIFEPFTQADSSTTRRYGGTGLGLSLSKALAKHLGGDITAKSLMNTGSQFALCLNSGVGNGADMVRTAEQIPRTSKEDEINLDAELGIYCGKILLAEDNPDNQRLLTHLLGKLGVELDIVANGKIAVDKASNCRYDLILMDMQMPVMGGLEAVSVLREKGYSHPIVALTANAMRKDKEECLQIGCNDFLTKPIDRQALYAVANKFLVKTNITHKIQARITSELLLEDPGLIDLIESYRASLPATFDSIQQLEASSDWAGLSAIIHQLKGTGGGMGFSILTELAGKIEFQIANENTAAVHKLVGELGDIVTRIVGADARVAPAIKLIKS